MLAPISIWVSPVLNHCNNDPGILIRLFIGVFLYAIVAMVVSRELVIPSMTSSINGHIAGDPQYYHSLALKKAKEIRRGGMAEFELRPEGQGVAGLASLLYQLGESPYGVVLLNAAMHALSVVVMAMILVQWFPRRTSIIATLPLAISPYMIVWFSQLNKDTFALAGALLFTYGLSRLVCTEGRPTLGNGRLLHFLVAVAGILLTWVVRPYVNQILLPFAGIILTSAFLLRMRRGRGNHADWIGFAMYGVFVLACLGLLGKGAASDATLDKLIHSDLWNQTQTQTVSAKCFSTIDEKNWRNHQWLPDAVNEKLKAMMGQRCLMFTILETQPDPAIKDSYVDMDRFPGGSVEALAYLPRAALLGVFSPWPDSWGYIFSHNPSSAFYTITPIEAAILYVGLVSLFVWLVLGKTWEPLIPIGICVTVMTIYGMATPFLGALYRYRYPWWMLLICLGVAAFLTLTGHKANERR